jgi:hypothetical protein
MLARIAMIAITTRSSIRVKAELLCFLKEHHLLRRFLIALDSFSFPGERFFLTFYPQKSTFSDAEFPYGYLAGTM